MMILYQQRSQQTPNSHQQQLGWRGGDQTLSRIYNKTWLKSTSKFSIPETQKISNVVSRVSSRKNFTYFLCFPWGMSIKKKAILNMTKVGFRFSSILNPTGHFEKKRTNMESIRSLGHLREKGKPLAAAEVYIPSIPCSSTSFRGS